MWKVWERISQQPQTFYLHSWRCIYLLDPNLVCKFEGCKQMPKAILVVEWLTWTFCREWEEGRMKWRFKTKQNVGKSYYWINIISSARLKETTTSPVIMSHQQQCFCQDVYFSLVGFILLSTEKGDWSPGTVPRLIQTATCRFPSLLQQLWWLQGGFHLQL